MRSALNTLRLPEETQSALLRLLAALLHLGNVKFGAEDDKEKGVEGSKVVREPVAKGAKESSDLAGLFLGDDEHAHKMPIIVEILLYCQYGM